MKTIKTPPLETGGETNWEEEFEIFTQDYEDVFNQYVCCSGGVKGDVDCACNGILWKEKIKDFISHTNASVTEQTARETILELLSLMQAMPINERMGMPRHLVAIDLHKYAKSKGISLSEQPLEKE